MKIARFEITHGMLVQMLGFPDDTTIIDIRPSDNSFGGLIFKATSDDFDDIGRGDAIPLVSPQLSVTEMPCCSVELIAWSWKK